MKILTDSLTTAFLVAWTLSQAQGDALKESITNTPAISKTMEKSLLVGHSHDQCKQERPNLSKRFYDFACDN